MAAPTPEQLRRLTGAFPAQLAPRVEQAARALDMDGYGVQDFHVGEVVASVLAAIDLHYAPAR
jgi:hypothetical protein